MKSSESSSTMRSMAASKTPFVCKYGFECPIWNTPGRKRSPLKGKNAPDQSENSKPVEDLNTRQVDEHRLPIGGRSSSNASAKSIDLSGKTSKASTTSKGMEAPSLRRMSLLGSLATPFQKSASDVARLCHPMEVEK